MGRVTLLVNWCSRVVIWRGTHTHTLAYHMPMKRCPLMLQKHKYGPQYEH